jgi:hypothetical protein
VSFSWFLIGAFAVPYAITPYKADTTILFSAWCGVCYYRYTNRSTGMHQQEAILLAPQKTKVTVTNQEALCDLVHNTGSFWRRDGLFLWWMEMPHHVHPPLLFPPANHTLYNALDQCLRGDSLSYTTLPVDSKYKECKLGWLRLVCAAYLCKM